MTAIRLEHSGNAAATTIVGLISDSDLTIVVADATGWPLGSTAPFIATIGAGTASEEKIKVTSRTGTTLTVASRGFDSNTPQTHASGAAITHTHSATEADESNEAAVAVAAATGGLVGRTQTQTLTNKTVDLTSNTLTGTKAQFNTAMSDADFATLAGTEALTNKTIDGDLNTLQDIPVAAIKAAAWTAYTPTLVGGTLGAGTIAGRWQQIGKTVHFYAIVQFAADTSVSGNPGLTLPSAPLDLMVAAALLFDASANVVRPATLYNSPTTSQNCIIATPTGLASASVPWTWANLDTITVSGTYEAA